MVSLAKEKYNLYQELHKTLALSGIIFDLAVLNTFLSSERERHHHHKGESDEKSKDGDTTGSDNSGCEKIPSLKLPSILQRSDGSNEPTLNQPGFLDDLPRTSVEIADWINSNLDVLKHCNRKTYEEFDKEALIAVANHVCEVNEKKFRKNEESDNTMNEVQGQKELKEEDELDGLLRKCKDIEMNKTHESEIYKDNHTSSENINEYYKLLQQSASDEPSLSAKFDDHISHGILEYFDSKFAFDGLDSEIVYAISSNPVLKRITVTFRGSIESGDWKTNATVTAKHVDFTSSFTSCANDNNLATASAGTSEQDNDSNKRKGEGSGLKHDEQSEQEQVKGDKPIDSTVSAESPGRSSPSQILPQVAPPVQAVLEIIPPKPDINPLPIFRRSSNDGKTIRNYLRNPNKECLEAFSNIHVHSGFYNYLFTEGTKHVNSEKNLQELRNDLIKHQESAEIEAPATTPPTRKSKCKRGKSLHEKISLFTGQSSHSNDRIDDYSEHSDVNVPRVTKFLKIMNEINTLLDKYNGYDLYFTGHSLGAALATLCATAASMSDDIKKPVRLISFASPHVFQSDGVEAFKFLEERGRIQHIRVTNDDDIVPRGLGGFGYKHCGINVQFNHGRSKVSQLLVEGVRVIPGLGQRSTHFMRNVNNESDGNNDSDNDNDETQRHRSNDGHSSRKNRHPLYDIQQSNLSSEKIRFIRKNLGINYKWFVGVPHDFTEYFKRLEENRDDFVNITINELYDDKDLTSYSSG